MKFDNKTMNFLNGSLLNNALEIMISTSQSIIYDRINYLSTAVEGEKNPAIPNEK